MPLMDGFAATSEIRLLEASPPPHASYAAATATATASASASSSHAAPHAAPSLQPARAPSRRVPVLAVTTFAGSDVLPPGELTGVEAALGGTVDALSCAVGMDGVMTKPVAFAALQALLARLMRAEEEVAAAAAAACAGAARGLVGATVAMAVA
jgi:CheY-like chemotaxis protein